MFSAIDLNSGKVVWQQRVNDPMVGGALVTAGDVVFTGHGDGRFVAYAAKDGKELWQHQSTYGVNAPPVSYMINGVQYVAVAAGGNRLFGYKTGDEVLVFKLGKR